MKFVLTQPLDEAAMKVLKEAGADVYIANSPDLPSYIVRSRKPIPWSSVSDSVPQK